MGQILAILPSQLLAQCLQLTAKQDNPFCGSLVAPTELPPRMPIICTQSPAENTLGEVRREGENWGRDPKENMARRTSRGLQLLSEASEGWEERVDCPLLRCS